jgi:hypothetical protein
MELASQFIVRTITPRCSTGGYVCELSHQAIYVLTGPRSSTAEGARLSLKDAIRDELDRREALRPNGHLRKGQLQRMELLQKALREI